MDLVLQPVLLDMAMKIYSLWNMKPFKILCRCYYNSADVRHVQQAEWDTCIHLYDDWALQLKTGAESPTFMISQELF